MTKPITHFTTNWAQKDKVRPHVYQGEISRDYEKKAKFSIAFPGKVPYTVSSSRSLSDLENVHKGAVVKKV